jgi:hypothetical protein
VIPGSKPILMTKRSASGVGGEGGEGGEGREMGEVGGGVGVQQYTVHTTAEYSPLH